jgi:hypothetical protein
MGMEIPLFILQGLNTVLFVAILTPCLLPIFAMLVLLQLSALFVLSPSPSDPYLATCF